MKRRFDDLSGEAQAMLNKVLILSASAGAGHVRAAQAIERAFAKMNAAREVRHVDTLDYTSKMFRRMYSKAYIELANKMPEFLGWLYDFLDKPWKNERRRLALDKLNTRPFVKLLRQYQPDISISTHFLPAEIVSWLKAKERLATRQAIVVTDFDVHAMWLCHHYEHYFVALDVAPPPLKTCVHPPQNLRQTTFSGSRPFFPFDSLEWSAFADRKAMWSAGLRESSEGLNWISLSEWLNT